MKSPAKNLLNLPRTYQELCEVLMPRTVHDDVELANMKEIVDALAVRQNLNQEQADYLETLSQLMEAYEAERIPMPDTTPLQALKYLMEQNSITAPELTAILDCDQSLTYKILRGERRLSANHAHRLAARFRVGLEVFLQPSGA